MNSRRSSLAGLVLVVVAACTPTGTAAPTVAAPTQLTPTAVATAAPSEGPTDPPTQAPTAAPTEAPTAAPTTAPVFTVIAREVGNAGLILVAGSNRMTLYWFEQDVRNSGASACTGECRQNWPPLTVAAGTPPTGGPGVTGRLGTITRPNGGLQVTYRGLPLYFFQNDQEPGDLNGVYENWVTVAP